MLKIKIILGSTRKGRFGDKVAKWFFSIAKKSKDIEVELLDLRDYSMPFFDEEVSPSMTTKKYSNKIVQKWAEKIGEGDGFVIVTPEYNHGYPAVLKNALDYVYHEWNKKPVAFVSYGGSAGGTRAVQQLRQVAIELQLVPIRPGIHFVNYWDHLDDKGNLIIEDADKKAQHLLTELIWFANLLKSSKK